MHRISTAIVALCLVVFGPALHAQTFGEITGTVADSTAAVIPGATVTITNNATNQVRTVQTNEAGNFAVPFLVPGVYIVKAEKDGFKSASRPNLTLQVGDVARVDFELEVGVVTETVEVTGGAVLLQTESTSLGTVIDNQRIVQLPLNGRNYLSLVKASPYVSAEMRAGGQANSRQGGERSNQAISIAGQRQQFNRFTLDGVENTDPNFNSFIMRPSVDALQEFKVQTGVYSAEFGRATAQVNVTTKSGSNEFHGTVFEFHRNENLRAKGWNDPNEKNHFVRNQYGFTVGGPIMRNKLFFMGNFEGLRDRESQQRTARVATVKMRQGDFSELGIDGLPVHPQLYDPGSLRNEGGRVIADPFPNNMIPGTKITSASRKMLEFYPDPNLPGVDLSAINWNYIRDQNTPVTWDQITSRIDWTESDSSQWFGRLSWGDENVIRGATFPTQEGRTATKVWQAMISNTRSFSPAVVNELRLGANVFDNDQLLHFAFERDVTSELGIPGLNPPDPAAWGTPQVSMGGPNNEVAGWGESTEGPFINKNRTYQIIDNLAWVRGNHTIKFGGELAQRRFNQIGNQFPRGNFVLENRYSADPTNVSRTGTAFATYLLGWTTESTRAAGIANTQFRQLSSSMYIEDSWKIRPNLTINFGLRYEITPAWHDKHRGFMNVQMFCTGVDDTGVDEDCPIPVLVRPGDGDFYEGVTFHFADTFPIATGDDVIGSTTSRSDFNDFAPRFGVAWSPTSKLSIRTGYGSFYAQDTGNPVFDLARNLAGRSDARSSDAFPTSNFNDPWANETSSAVCTGWSGTCLSDVYTFANNLDRRTPYIHQWMFNVQRQLSDATVLEVGYQGNAGHKLERMRSYNSPLHRNGPTDTTSLANRRPWGNRAYGRIQYVDNVVNSNYHALGVRLQKRYERGLTYLIGYTWAKAIDNGSAIRTNDGDSLFPPNVYDLDHERGLSQFDTRHRLTASILYDLPLSFQNSALNAIAGGWQLGSIVTFSTGTPWEVGSCGQLNSNEFGTRPDATGSTPVPDSPNADVFWNRSAFTCNSPVTVSGVTANALTFRDGSSGRNVLTTPGFANLDFAVLKTFRITERYSLEFRFESFNFTNHPNLGVPNTNPTSGQFGRITGAREMRTNQFGLKFSF